MKKIVSIFCIVLFLQACQSKPVLVSGNGILIAQVSSTGLDGLENSVPVINNKKYPGGLKGGYLIITLPPGEYTLNHFLYVPMIASSDGVIVEDFETLDTVYPVDRKFRVEAGKATNLGKLFYYDTSSERYKAAMDKNMSTAGFYHGVDDVYYLLAYLDNGAAMRHYISENHAELYNFLTGNKMRLERGNYLSLKNLKNIQNDTATNALWLKLKRHETIGTYVGGKAGSVGVVDHSQNLLKIEKVIKTNNVMNFSDCNGDRSRLVCMLDRQHYITVYNNTVTKHKVPANIEVNSAFITDSLTVLVDDYFTLYTKLHDAKRWKKNSHYKTNNPVVKNSSTSISTNAFTFTSTKNGFYIFAYNQNSAEFPVLFNDNKTTKFSLLSFPEKIENIIAIKDTTKGLYAAISRRSLSNSEIFYLSDLSEDWVKYMIPASACLDIIFLDPAGDNIEALCEQQQIGLISYNGGETWLEQR